MYNDIYVTLEIMQPASLEKTVTAADRMMRARGSSLLTYPSRHYSPLEVEICIFFRLENTAHELFRLRLELQLLK
jgi:hypothetical protein